MTTDSGSRRRSQDPRSILRGAPDSVPSSSPNTIETANFPLRVFATGLPLKRRTAQATPGTLRTRVRSVSLRGLVWSKYSVCGSITQTSASVTSRIWLAVRRMMLAKIEVWFSRRKVQKAMANTRPKYLARSPVSIRRATKFMRHLCGRTRDHMRIDVDTSDVPKQRDSSGRTRGRGEGRELGQQPLPALGAKPVLEAPLCALPGGRRPVELGPARPGQLELPLAAVFPRLTPDPSLRLQRAKGPAQRRAVEGEKPPQASLSNRSRLGERLQQGELSRVDPGVPELLIVEVGGGPGGPAQASAGAGCDGQGVFPGASLSHVRDNMYLHLTCQVTSAAG